MFEKEGLGRFVEEKCQFRLEPFIVGLCFRIELH